MPTHFEQELDELKNYLLAMAARATENLGRALKGLVEHNSELLQSVIHSDTEIDRFEIDVDALAVRLLAKAPLARDLRFITTAMKISHELERVGDEATTISRRGIELSREPQLKPYVDLPRMAQQAIHMLNDALGAFIHHDPVAAREIIPRDKEIDALNDQLHRELSSYMVESPATISRCLNLMVISKSLERVADHAKNIAEDVVYLYEGRDIRHPKALGGDAQAPRGASAQPDSRS